MSKGEGWNETITTLSGPARDRAITISTDRFASDRLKKPEDEADNRLNEGLNGSKKPNMEALARTNDIASDDSRNSEAESVNNMNDLTSSSKERTLENRTIALAAASTEAGIRVYTRDSNGYVRELCNDITAPAFGAAANANAKDLYTKWILGSQSFECSANSALCSFARPLWRLSVFYQDAKGAIREQRYDDSKWVDTGFTQNNAMSGTNITTVNSTDGARVVLFFQDKEGMIRYRTAEGLKWSTDSAPLVKAVAGTGIGTTTWNDLDEIRVYYQDEKYYVREYHGSFGDRSQTAFGEKYEVLVGKIAAASWRYAQTTEIRLYLQNESNTIIERSYGGKNWLRGQFEVKASPNADIIAFMRPFDNGARCALHVIWAGQDQQLWQRVIVPRGRGWLEPTVIASIRYAGDYAGGWIGEQFTDVSEDVASKSIVKVRVRCGDIIDAIQIEFDDGSSTPLRGGKGGGEQVFILNPGEDIIRITCVSDREWIHRLQFDTSDKRQSPWYGVETLDKRSAWYSDSYATHVWYSDGRALAGFLGCTKNYMKDINPIWSDRYSKASFKNIDDYVREAERLNRELSAIKGCLSVAQRRVVSYKTSLGGLRTLGAEAVGGLVALAGEIEYLHDMAVASAQSKLGAKEHRARDVERQAAMCKEDSDMLETRFKELGEALAQVKPVGDEIHADIARILSEAKVKVTVTKTFASWTEAYDREVIQRKARVTQQRDWSQRELEKAEAYLKDKQNDLNSIRELGLHAPAVSSFEDSLPETIILFDMINSELEQAKISRDKKTVLLQKFQGELAGIEMRAKKINAVHTCLGEFAKDVQAEANAINALVGESSALQEMTGKYQALLVHLNDEAHPLDKNNQAQGFAAGLLPIVHFALEAPYLKELLKDNSAVLESRVKIIAEYRAC